MNKLANISELLARPRPMETPVSIDSNRTVSWAEFSSNVQGLCSEITADPAPEWILHCNNSLTFAVGFMALIHAGKSIILPHNIQEGTLREMDIPNAKLLTDKPVKNSPFTLITLNLNTISKIPFEIEPLDSEKIIIKLFTSGSSDKPKLIVKTLSQLEAEIRELERVWGGSLSDCTFCATVIHQHIYGLLFSVLWPLYRNSVFQAQLMTTPEELERLYGKHRRIALISSPAFMRRLNSAAMAESFTSGRFTVFSSGGLLDKHVADDMSALFGSYPIEVLGSTETGGVAYRTQEDGMEAWCPFDAVETKLDKDHQLLIRSPYISSRSFTPMGDTAEFLSGEKRFLLKGRIDKIAKIEEKRVSLTEIEARLNQHPLVEKALSTLTGNKRQMIGVAMVLNSKGRKAFEDSEKREINNFFRNYLLGYFEPVVVPRKWRYIDSIPLNPQGKVVASELKALFE